MVQLGHGNPHLARDRCRHDCLAGYYPLNEEQEKLWRRSLSLNRL